ncbi:hypothetical protein C1Y02_25175 [Pseudomonas sp. FW306-02-F04-AA]|nr:hypothetical protein C1X96_23650 [Pseudomonas sp. FW300-N1A5]PNB27574.1 hypothetical protein C1Y02_25175 [Pseudomonas sp. FW306-02-F04-AA]
MAGELAPAGLRSSPDIKQPRRVRHTGANGFGAALRPSGSKLPRHKGQHKALNLVPILITGRRNPANAGRVRRRTSRLSLSPKG